jgi:hypothetical protein
VKSNVLEDLEVERKKINEKKNIEKNMYLLTEKWNYENIAQF